MKYPYRIKKNGIIYMPNTEVPDDDAVVENKAEETKVSEKTEASEEENNATNDATEDNGEASDEAEEIDSNNNPTEPQKEFVPDPGYTKSQINRLPLIELRVMAEKEGIEDVPNKTGTELKRELIEKFGL